MVEVHAVPEERYLGRAKPPDILTDCERRSRLQQGLRADVEAEQLLHLAVGSEADAA